MARMYRGEPHTFADGDAKSDASGYGVQAVASTSVNVFGSWVTLVASTARSVDFIALQLDSGTGGSSDMPVAVDIGVGAAASEVTVCERLLYARSGTRRNSAVFQLPIHVPAGERIAVRCKNQTTVAVGVSVSAQLYTNSGFAKDSVSFIKASYNTTGFTVDPGATADTFGAWVDVATSATIPAGGYKGLILGFNIFNNAAPRDARWNVQLAFGTAGNEEIVADGIWLGADSIRDTIEPQTHDLRHLWVPEGTTIRARAKCDHNDATDRVFLLGVLGLN